jgi:hypothetical protein
MWGGKKSKGVLHGYFTPAAKIEGNFTSEPMIGWQTAKTSLVSGVNHVLLTSGEVGCLRCYTRLGKAI